MRRVAGDYSSHLVFFQLKIHLPTIKTPQNQNNLVVICYVGSMTMETNSLLSSMTMCMTPQKTVILSTDVVTNKFSLLNQWISEDILQNCLFIFLFLLFWSLFLLGVSL